MKIALLFFSGLACLKTWAQDGLTIEQRLQAGVQGCGIVKNVQTVQPKKSSLQIKQAVYVVDGILWDSGEIRNLDPNLIETVQVLKDSAVNGIYCSRASTNGIIVITTKRIRDTRFKVLNLNDSLPIHGANVRLASPEIEKSFQTDLTGEVDLPDLSIIKEYFVGVEGSGYTSFNQKIKFDSSKQTQTVYLKKAVKKSNPLVPNGAISSNSSLREEYSNQPADHTMKPVTFSLFPNPVQQGSMLTIRSQITLDCNFQILSMVGQVLEVGKLTTNAKTSILLNTKNLSPSTYLLRLTDRLSGKQITEKFIIQ